MRVTTSFVVIIYSEEGITMQKSYSSKSCVLSSNKISTIIIKSQLFFYIYITSFLSHRIVNTLYVSFHACLGFVFSFCISKYKQSVLSLRIPILQEMVASKVSASIDKELYIARTLWLKMVTNVLEKTTCQTFCITWSTQMVNDKDQAVLYSVHVNDVARRGDHVHTSMNVFMRNSRTGRMVCSRKCLDLTDFILVSGCGQVSENNLLSLVVLTLR